MSDNSRRTASELAKLIGRYALWTPAASIQVKVKIIDVRDNFGRLDFLVSPLPECGSGQAWVAESSIDVR